MYLTDLAFIEEGTPNFTEEGLVNFSKMRMVNAQITPVYIVLELMVSGCYQDFQRCSSHFVVISKEF